MQSNRFIPQSGKILLVETDITIRNQIQEYLERKGFSVNLCTNCEEVPSIVQEAQINLVILNINALDPSHIHSLRQLQKQFPAVQMVLIANQDDAFITDRIHSFMQQGIVGFLLKPFTISDMDPILSSTFENSVYSTKLL